MIEEEEVEEGEVNMSGRGVVETMKSSTAPKPATSIIRRRLRFRIIAGDVLVCIGALRRRVYDRDIRVEAPSYVVRCEDLVWTYGCIVFH